MLKAKLH